MAWIKKASCGTSGSDRIWRGGSLIFNRMTSNGRFRCLCGSASRFDSGSEGSSVECGVEVSKTGGDKIQFGLLFLSDRRDHNGKKLNWRVAALEDADLQPIWVSI